MCEWFQRVPTWRPDLASRLGVPFQRVPTWRPELASQRVPTWRPELGGVQRVPNELFIKVQSGGSRGCVIVHTGGTPLYPPKIGVIPARPDLAKILTGSIQRVPANWVPPKSGVLGVQIGANLCKFVQICAIWGVPKTRENRGFWGGGGVPPKRRFFRVFRDFGDFGVFRCFSMVKSCEIL